MARVRGSGDRLGATPKDKSEEGGTGGGWRGWGGTTRLGDARLSTGMARVSGSRRPEGIHFKIALPGSALCAVAFFLLVSLSGVICMPRGHPVQIPELASIPSLDEWTISEIAEMLANTEPQDREKKLATILERMQQMMQQQQQQEEAMEAAAEEGAAMARMAMPPPLVQGRTAIDDDPNGDDEGKGKRGEKSFMSLCHFKICNMGRKRNMRYNPWNRV